MGKWPKNHNIPKWAKNHSKVTNAKATPSVLGDVGLKKVVSEFSFKELQ